MRKPMIAGMLAALLGCAVALAGCGSADTGSTAPEETSPVSSQAENSAAVTAEIQKAGDQLDPPEIGEEIAVIETTQGAIKLRLFPEQAPKTVANFKQLAEAGVYDGLDFHRIIDGFMIQTGQSDSTSIYGGYFEDEFSESLLNLRGAVSMANIMQPDTNTTQFFINQTPAESFSGWSYFQQVYEQVYLSDPERFTQSYGSWPDMSKVTDEVKALYEENGGNPTLDGAYTTTGLGHTVFGQVFEGMDVVDAIAAAETDANDAPVSDDYRIERITFETYQG